MWQRRNYYGELQVLMRIVPCSLQQLLNTTRGRLRTLTTVVCRCAIDILHNNPNARIDIEQFGLLDRHFYAFGIMSIQIISTNAYSTLDTNSATMTTTAQRPFQIT